MKLKKISACFIYTLSLALLGCHAADQKTVISVPQSESELLQIDYQGFSLWMDCDRRSPVRFAYHADKDTGNHPRHSQFYLDPNVPKSCQQTSTSSYKTQEGTRYDRGHMVPANHLDGNQISIRQSNFMTNILPQAASMNRGAWLQTEEIVECYRSLEPLEVFGGALYEIAMPVNFPKHGLDDVPSHFWKVILRDKRAIAWIIPNSPEAKRKKIDEYLVSVAQVEQRAGVKIDTLPYLKEKPLQASWVIPIGCDKS